MAFAAASNLRLASRGQTRAYIAGRAHGSQCSPAPRRLALEPGLLAALRGHHLASEVRSTPATIQAQRELNPEDRYGSNVR